MLSTKVTAKIFPKQKGFNLGPYATEEEILAARTVFVPCHGIEVPETAKNSTYVDLKCPFTGNVKVTSGTFTGVVLKMKSGPTIVVAWNYLYYCKKYKRFSRRNTKASVHMSPCFEGLIKVGDTVVCGRTRKLSKTVSSVVLAFTKKEEKEKLYKVADFN